MADHKEYWSTESDQGSIRISEDVVASIAALSASETKGVSGLYSSLTSDLVGFISKKNLSKGVRIELGDDDTVKVEIGFLALFGYNICDVAKEVQENVKSSIESMTGLRVVEINVHVGGVTFKPSASTEEKAEPAPRPKLRRRRQTLSNMSKTGMAAAVPVFLLPGFMKYGIPPCVLPENRIK